MGKLVRMPPRGRYAASEVGQLAGVSGRTIGQWSRRGYITASQSDAIPKVYSFQDAAEAMVVHELFERGVTHRSVLTAIGALREYGDWPLTGADLAVARDGSARSRLIARHEGASYDIGDRGWQSVINAETLQLISSLLRRGGWAVRQLPDLQHVEVDPDRLSGRPAIRGHRISAQEVAEIADEPNGIDDLVEGYGLTRAEIDDARAWWHEVQKLAA
jgi:uncharacterized protein (DUF433 family)/DNA-binding transcriptional MerR regulator